MPKQKLNVAMIGAGFIAKAHSNAFQQVGRVFPTSFEFGLRVICARNQAKLEVMASHWGWQEVSTGWQEIVSRKDVQVVDIAVPNASQGPSALAAAAAGQMLLCEQ